MRCFRQDPTLRGPSVLALMECPLSSLRSPNTNPGDLGGTQPCKDTRHAALEVVCEVDETADLPLCLVCFGFVGSVSCKA